MSLFKVRDFWSFDLDHLKQNSDNHDARSPSYRDESASKDRNSNNRAQFVVSVGRFGSIGDQDVFVCGHLEGNVYIVQVPDSDQRRFIGDVSSKDQDSKGSSSSATSSRQISTNQDVGERQLLAATNLNMMLVDVKCGFFTSALKQSIAILGSDKLIIMTVKRQQRDLITGPEQADLSSSSSRLLSLEDNLLSHEFEEHIKLDLLHNEFAYGLIVLNSHADSSLVDSSKHASKETDLDLINREPATKSETATRNFYRSSKQVVQQLHLPQRDKIVIQYTNQFVFTLIDSKKIIGHFSLRNLPESATETTDNDKSNSAQLQNELKLSQMSQYFGCMPMAHLITSQKSSQSSLIISLSDHCIYCLTLDKLTSQARQNVVNRVALDLLSSNRAAKEDGPLVSSLNSSRNPTALSSSKTGASGQQQAIDNLTEIDPNTVSEWCHELTSLPLQMQGLQRQTRATQLKRERIVIGQLLVMSRYSLDLFASSGEHLWHQRFETPLICLQAYTIELSPSEPIKANDKSSSASNQSSANTDEQRQRQSQESTANDGQVKDKFVLDDQIVSLVCSDSLRDDRSNLMILKDDHMSWSAVLNSKPIQVWRLNLTQMPGLIAMLDMRSDQLIASYLGTNLDTTIGDATDAPEETLQNEEASSNPLVELERLNDPLFNEDRLGADSSKDDQRKRLLITNQIEMGTSDGTVNVCTNIRLEPSSTSVIHNIVVTFEYDNLFKFELINCGVGQSVEHLAHGVTEVQVGNCWPDRREPLKIEASFCLLSASSTKQVGVAAMNQMSDNGPEQHYANSSRSMPKSLKVCQYVTFNETHSGVLHQEQSFMLPISVVAQLTHVDYSIGHGQDLDDVLNNLTGYKRAETNPTPYLYCDIFLGVKCDLFNLLHEFIEGDLICRGRHLISNQPRVDKTNNDTKDGPNEASIERRMETMESINLLAQSLNCRIRYMSPSPSSMARQSSEELVQPKMTSFALILRNSYLSLADIAPSETDRASTDTDDERIVWIHVCDLSPPNELDIVADFVTLHMKDWKNFNGDAISEQETAAQKHNSKVLISIESQHPMVVVFIVSHLIERVRNLCTSDAFLDTKLIKRSNHADIQKGFIDKNLDLGSCHLAISSALHDALVSMEKAYETEHKSKVKQLQADLSKEFSKYQVVTDSSLSLSKRLPSLPDDLSGQLNDLMMQAKESQLKLMHILDGLEALKKQDFELTKLPASSLIKTELSSSSNIVSWSGFDAAFG